MTSAELRIESEGKKQGIGMTHNAHDGCRFIRAGCYRVVNDDVVSIFEVFPDDLPDAESAFVNGNCENVAQSKVVAGKRH